MTDSTQLSVRSYDAIYSTEPSNGSTYAALHVAISAYLDKRHHAFKSYQKVMSYLSPPFVLILQRGRFN